MVLRDKIRLCEDALRGRSGVGRKSVHSSDRAHEMLVSTSMTVISAWAKAVIRAICRLFIRYSSMSHSLLTANSRRLKAACSSLPGDVLADALEFMPHYFPSDRADLNRYLRRVEKIDLPSPVSCQHIFTHNPYPHLL
jgi:hypothetical protein